jgi:DNA-binding NtrC family response regulator
MIQAMGGTIEVESQLNAGSKFSIHLKLFTAEEKQAKELNAFVEKRVLIVDDTKVNRTILKKYLEKANMMVDEADHPFKAREMIERSYDEEQPYDIVFTDYYMPDMNGVELIQNMKKDIRCNKLQFIIFTNEQNVGSEIHELKFQYVSSYLEPLRKKGIMDIVSDVFKVKKSIGEIILFSDIENCRAWFSHAISSSMPNINILKSIESINERVEQQVDIKAIFILTNNHSVSNLDWSNALHQSIPVVSIPIPSMFKHFFETTHFDPEHTLYIALQEYVFQELRGLNLFKQLQEGNQ